MNIYQLVGKNGLLPLSLENAEPVLQTLTSASRASLGTDSLREVVFALKKSRNFKSDESLQSVITLASQVCSPITPAAADRAANVTQAYTRLIPVLDRSRLAKMNRALFEPVLDKESPCFLSGDERLVRRFTEKIPRWENNRLIRQNPDLFQTVRTKIGEVAAQSYGDSSGLDLSTKLFNGLRDNQRVRTNSALLEKNVTAIADSQGIAPAARLAAIAAFGKILSAADKNPAIRDADMTLCVSTALAMGKIAPAVLEAFAKRPKALSQIAEIVQKPTFLSDLTTFATQTAINNTSQQREILCRMLDTNERLEVVQSAFQEKESRRYAALRAQAEERYRQTNDAARSVLGIH